jgi:propionyl-CoA carboxylase alpha chain
VRVDTGVVEGSEISIYYDPLISKLITYGPSRDVAIEKMKHALDTYVIKGVKHNIPLLRDIISHPRFMSGDINTKFIPEVYPGGFKDISLSEREAERLAGIAAYMKARQDARAREYVNEAHVKPSAAAKGDTHEYRVKVKDTFYTAAVAETSPGHYDLHVNNKKMALAVDWPVYSPLLEAKVDGEEVVVQHLGHKTYTLNLGFKGSLFDVKVLTPHEHELYKYMPAKLAVDMSRIVVAPMPGQVVSVSVKAGDTVNEGQEVAVVEAMKMQNSLRAQRSGKVKAVNVKVGQNVQPDDVMVELEDTKKQ